MICCEMQRRVGEGGGGEGAFQGANGRNERDRRKREEDEKKNMIIIMMMTIIIMGKLVSAKTSFFNTWGVTLLGCRSQCVRL